MATVDDVILYLTAPVEGTPLNHAQWKFDSDYYQGVKNMVVSGQTTWLTTTDNGPDRREIRLNSSRMPVLIAGSEQRPVYPLYRDGVSVANVRFGVTATTIGLSRDGLEWNIDFADGIATETHDVYISSWHCVVISKDSSAVSVYTIDNVGTTTPMTVAPWNIWENMYGSDILVQEDGIYILSMIQQEKSFTLLTRLSADGIHYAAGHKCSHIRTKMTRSADGSTLSEQIFMTECTSSFIPQGGRGVSAVRGLFVLEYLCSSGWRSRQSFEGLKPAVFSLELGREYFEEDYPTSMRFTMYPEEIDPSLSPPYVVHNVVLGPDIWPCVAQINTQLYLIDMDRTVETVAGDVKALLTIGHIYNAVGPPILSTVFVTTDDYMHIVPGAFPIDALTTSATGTLSDNGTLRLVDINVQMSFTQAPGADTVLTTLVPLKSTSTFTFSHNRLFVAIKDTSSGQYKVRRFMLYTRELFDTHLGDAQIEEYLGYFKTICESEYGEGDPFCRCANFDGSLAQEYNLDGDTYELKRIQRTVQCLDDDCIYRKNLQNNLISVHKLQATKCDMDLTICSTRFNPNDVSGSSQVNVINQCGSGSPGLPSLVNGSGQTGFSNIWSIILCVLTGCIVAVLLIGLYYYVRRKRL